MTSPAPSATTVAPMIHRLACSATILTKPPVSRFTKARGTADSGKIRHAHLIPCALACPSVSPTAATFGVVKIIRGTAVKSTLRSAPSNALRAARLVGSSRGSNHGRGLLRGPAPSRRADRLRSWRLAGHSRIRCGRSGSGCNRRGACQPRLVAGQAGITVRLITWARGLIQPRALSNSST